jgi:hypothetical protein
MAHEYEQEHESKGPPMKCWACAVAILYVLILAALTVPIAAVASGKWPDLNDWAEIFSGWPIWLTLFICQFAMLTVPARLIGLRPCTHWSQWPSILASGFMMAGLVVGAWLALCECFRWEYLSWLLLLAIGPLAWLFWSLVFFRLSRKVTPVGLVSHQCRTLFKISILELLIAVPAHIVSSHRVGMFAGTATSIGLMVGIAVMLSSFGPAAFLLYAARWRRSNPAAATCETDSTPHLVARQPTPGAAFGALACILLALILSAMVQPLPTQAARSSQFLQGLNKEFEKNGWVSDGKGGWTTDPNTINYKKLNRQMEEAGWITLSNGHYTLPANSKLLQKQAAYEKQ